MCGWCLKKNQSAPRPSEHPPVMGEKMSKRLGGIKERLVGVVLEESSTPDCKENKQADAGSRLFSKAFSVRRVVVQLFIGRAWRSIYT